MSRGQSVYHYATKEDYALIFEQLALAMPIKYVLDEARTDPHFEVFSSPTQYELFGTTKWPGTNSVCFLILPAHAEIPFEFMEHRQVPQKYGFFIPKPAYLHIYLQASGYYTFEDNPVGLMEGRFSTNSENPESITIFKAVKKVIRKHWKCFQAVYFGPSAWKFMVQGGTVGQDLRNPIRYKALLDSAGQK